MAIFFYFSVFIWQKGILVYIDAIIRFKSYWFYGQNPETHKISLSHNVETMSVHTFPALWQILALSSMKQHLRTEESVPIDTVLKAKTQKIALSQEFSYTLTQGKLIFSINVQICIADRQWYFVRKHVIYQNKSTWSVRAHGLLKHMIGQCKSYVNYQNRSTWPVRMRNWSKQKYLIYQNKNTWAMFQTYKYQLKAIHLSL